VRKSPKRLGIAPEQTRHFGFQRLEFRDVLV
jgi:hypothetical protein